MFSDSVQNLTKNFKICLFVPPLVQLFTAFHLTASLRCFCSFAKVYKFAGERQPGVLSTWPKNSFSVPCVPACTVQLPLDVTAELRTNVLTPGYEFTAHDSTSVELEGENNQILIELFFFICFVFFGVFL